MTRGLEDGWTASFVQAFSPDLRVTYVCDMVHSYVRCDASINVTRRIYMWDICQCDLHVTWCTHMCDPMLSRSWHGAFIRVIWLLRMCEMTRALEDGSVINLPRDNVVAWKTKRKLHHHFLHSSPLRSVMHRGPFVMEHAINLPRDNVVAWKTKMKLHHHLLHSFSLGSVMHCGPFVLEHNETHKRPRITDPE